MVLRNVRQCFLPKTPAQVSKSKPDPHNVLYICEKLGISADKTVMVRLFVFCLVDDDDDADADCEEPISPMRSVRLA